MKKWLLHTKKADFKLLSEKYGIDQIIARIMRNREIINEADFEKFLYGSSELLYSPDLLKDMDKAVDIIMKKIALQKKIRVIGDYDIDGVCSTYILFMGLSRLGADVDWDIPERVMDGYGLNERLVISAYEDGIDTIVTCDNGIAAIEQIELAKKYGMTVIITDHHDIPFEVKNDKKEYVIPDADAIINPKQADCNYPFKRLCGAVVAWKLIIALYNKNNIANEAMSFIEFAAMATVGDVMDLEDENRIIVKEGLRAINNTENIGLKALILANNLDSTEIKAYHIGYVLGPCLNASGRLDTAKRAVELLLTKTKEEADKAAWELKEFNENRKQLTEEWKNRAFEMIEETDLKNKKILLVLLPECHESLAGIIAGRIREKYYKPVLVFTKGDSGLKASGRSVEAYDMFEELSKCKSLFSKFGGHKMAAGLSMPEENFETLDKLLNENSNLSEDDLTEKIYIDVPVPLDYWNIELLEQLNILEPFGKGNSKPVFAEQHLSVLSMRKIGKNSDMLKLVVSNGRCRVEAMVFDAALEMLKFMEKEYGKSEVEAAFIGRNNSIDIAFAYYPSINEFRGEKNIQITVIDYCHIK